MYLPTLVATALTAIPLVAAHGDGIPGAPKIFGRGMGGALRPRREQQHYSHARRHAHAAQPLFDAGQSSSGLLKRQAVGGTDGSCGAGVGSCAKGYCCSSAGWCGQGKDYCAAPDCQFAYGPGCDANTIPPGASTSSVSRSKLGSVLLGGAGIYECTVNGMIALTYDDGPYIYTSAILDLLDKYNAKATFFITGNNLGKGEIDNAAYPWAGIIQRMYNSGHQIASHTWSHQDLSAITQAQRMNQMRYNEMALRNILGVFPTYMRPPYSSCTTASGCPADLKTLGYHITYFDLDTEDYLNPTPYMIQTSKNDFLGNISTATPATKSWLEVGHDIQEQTANNLTEYMLIQGTAQGYKFGTVGDCLGDPKANWYRSSSGSLFTSSASSSTATAAATSALSATSVVAAVVSPTSVSSDATCGGTTGQTCLGSEFGNCCSQSGYCGADSAYCGTGCQPIFGNCGSNAGSGSTSNSTSSGLSNLAVSTDATCGGLTGFTCQGSAWGNCCSASGYCGSTSDYCQNGCQTNFGSCGVAAISSAVAAGTSASVVASGISSVVSSVASSNTALEFPPVSTSTNSSAASAVSSIVGSVTSALSTSSAVLSTVSNVVSSLGGSLTSASIPVSNLTSGLLTVPTSGSVSNSASSSVSSIASGLISSSVANSTLSSVFSSVAGALSSVVSSVASSVVQSSTIATSSTPASTGSSSVVSTASSTLSASQPASPSSSATQSPSTSAASSASSSTPSSSSVASTSSTSSSVSSSKSSTQTSSTTSSVSSTKSSSTSSTPSSSSSITSSTSSKASSSSSSSTTSSKPSTSSTTTLATSASSSRASSSSSVSSSSTKTSSAVLSTSTALIKSTNGTCGADVKMTCDGLLLTTCCGSDNKCGTGLACMTLFGCQKKYGTCLL